MLSPLGRNFYLNITPNNLVRLYLSADAIAEGSPTSLRMRDLQTSDWDTTAARTTESLCSSRHVSNIQPPVTDCINGRIAPNCATLRTPSHKNIVANPAHKQSLSELVTSLRNSSSARTQVPNPVRLSSALQNTPSRSSVPHGSCCSLLEVDSVHRVQTAPLKPHDQSKISDSNQKYSSPSTAPRQALTVPESQCLRTPDQVTGAKFRFKRTTTTTGLSPIQFLVGTQQITTNSHTQSSAGDVRVTSANCPRSLMSTSVSQTQTAVGQAIHTDVDDVWLTGMLKLRFFFVHVIYFGMCKSVAKTMYTVDIV